METIEIQILAQDVNNSDTFMSNTNCALAKAIKRQLNIDMVEECVEHAYINDVTYLHDKYGYDEYSADVILAHDAPDDTLIRTILLNKHTT